MFICNVVKCRPPETRLPQYDEVAACVPYLFRQIELVKPKVILAMGGLAFLGLGTQPPSPDWGLMVSEGRGYILEQWWIATFPGIAIFVVVLAFNLIGDTLRDIFDPRQYK